MQFQNSSMDKNQKERCNNHRSEVEVIITSFLRVVYLLKYPSNACLCHLDNGLHDCCFYILSIVHLSYLDNGS